MLSPIIVVTSSAVCLLSIPFILNACHLGYVIPRLAQYLNVDRYVYGIEPVVLCLGIVTFYTYVLLGFVFDVIHALRPHYITSERSLLFTKLERAHQELRKLFPRKVLWLHQQYNLFIHVNVFFNNHSICCIIIANVLKHKSI